MNKQELIYKIEKLPYNLGPIVDTMKINRAGLIKLIEQLDEPQKPVVPQFVADWYEECKDNLEYNLWSYIYNWGTKEECNFKNWLDLGRNNPIQTLINMHQFGYTVDKEKRYYVRFKFIEDSYSYLTLIKHLDAWTLTNIKLDKKFRSEHTKKQLEDAGFGWVFDCPGIEIEEVEE